MMKMETKGRTEAPPWAVGLCVPPPLRFATLVDRITKTIEKHVADTKTRPTASEVEAFHRRAVERWYRDGAIAFENAGCSRTCGSYCVDRARLKCSQTCYAWMRFGKSSGRRDGDRKACFMKRERREWP